MRPAKLIRKLSDCPGGKDRPAPLALPNGPSRSLGSIIFPGYDGGCEWGGAAADPEGILYVNVSEMPWVTVMTPTQRDTRLPASARGQQLYTQTCAFCHRLDRSGHAAQSVPSLVDIQNKMSREEIVKLLGSGRGAMPSFAFFSEAERGAIADVLLGRTGAGASTNPDPASPPEGPEALGGVPYAITEFARWFDGNGYPAVKPPWGTLNAIDLNTGEYRWRVPLGVDPALRARGLPPTGLENYGGPLVTAGGLLFIGASRDEMFRAFDRKTGQVLWEYKLPAGGYATPSTYAVNGRQYVVIACGGGKSGTKSGDAYVAFALPEETSNR